MTPDRQQIQDHLERVLASAAFPSGQKMTALLRYLVHAQVEGRSDRLKG